MVSVYFLYALNLCNCIAVFSAQVVLSLYALHLGANAFGVGLVAAAFSIFPMSLAVTSGRIIDKHGGRWPMTFGAIAGGLGMTIPYFVHALPAIYVAAAMMGLSVIFFNLATQNLVGMVSTTETRGRNFSNYALTSSVSNFLGPTLGGFSVEHAGHAETCLIIALVTLVPVVMLALRGKSLPGGSHKAAKTKGSVRAMLADPVVRQTLITGSLLNTGLNLFQFYMPVYGHDIGLSASQIGTILGANAAAAFTSRFLLPKLLRRFGENRVLMYTFVLGAVGIASIPLFVYAPALVGIAFLFGFGMGCGQPIVIMLMYSNSRDGRSGEALGLKFTTNQLTKLVAPLIFGAIASGFGLLVMFWLNAAMLAGGAYMSRPKAAVSDPEAASTDR
ncbi:MAG TPA: MFS transporter [Burkholderiales bacterium]|nr:MFS transporter [Burkholderiales bacterium]